MGVLTLDEITAEVVYNLKNRSDSTITTARKNRWVNAAYRHMCLPTVHEFEELKDNYDITLVDGTNEYAIDKTTVGYKAVYVRSAHHILATTVTATAQKRRLSTRNIRWFDRRTLISGTPTIYSRDGDTLHLHPVPDSTVNGQIVRVRMFKEPVALTASDTTVLPDYYDEVLIIGAQWMAERSLGYRESAELTKQDYVAMLNEGADSYQLEAEDWDSQVDVNPHVQEIM